MTVTALDFPVKEFGGCDSTAIGRGMIRNLAILAVAAPQQLSPILATQMVCPIKAMSGLLLTAQ